MRQSKRPDAKNGRELTQAQKPPTLSKVRISALQQVLETLPPTQESVVAQVWLSVVKWPIRLRLHALRIIANKLAADIALRGLLLINRIAGGERQTINDDDTLQLDPGVPDDQQTLDELLVLWAHLPAHVQIQGDRDFERFVRITAGLQQMIDAAPPQATDSWAFDGGPQYQQMLSQARLLPAAAFTEQMASAPESANGSAVKPDDEVPQPQRHLPRRNLQRPESAPTEAF